MSFKIIISPNLEKTLSVLKRKDKSMFIAVQKKIIRVAECDEKSILHFKNLKSPLNNFRRVHVGSFVLIFKIEGDNIIFETFRHHDEAYD